VKDIYRDSEKI